MNSGLSWLAVAAALVLAPAQAATKKKPAAKPAPCACQDLKTVETHLRDQEYLLNLFTEWAAYPPGTVRTTQDIQDRANNLLQLTFYGSRSQAPLKKATGAYADLGTKYKEESCPVVLYEYLDGNPVMVPKEPLRKGQRPPAVLDLVHKATPVTEEEYDAHGQCAALVRYGFVHEAQHVKTCKAQFDLNKVSAWDKPQFFAEDDAKAYKAGVDVLRAERDRLRKQCETAPDNKWRGTLTYGYAYLNHGQDTIEKGEDVVYKQGTGWKEWGDHKSKRVRAWITATELAGSMKVAYSANYEWNSFSKGHFEIRKVECGSFKVRDWLTEAGNEKMYSGAVQGATDGHIYSDGRTVRVSFQTERLKGKYEARDWDDRTGHCNKPLDKKVNTSKSEATELEKITVSFEGKVDPENPNEIYIKKVTKRQDGKEQEYFEMRLRRAGP